MPTQIYQQVIQNLKDLIDRLDTIQINQKTLKQKLTKDLDIAKDKIEVLELKIHRLESHKKVSIVIAIVIGILVGLVLSDLVPNILGF